MIQQKVVQFGIRPIWTLEKPVDRLLELQGTHSQYEWIITWVTGFWPKSSTTTKVQNTQIASLSGSL
jgi:hypothetical protein